jgi:hypothetical protein
MGTPPRNCTDSHTFAQSGSRNKRGELGLY